MTIQIGDIAPDFTLQETNGDTVTLSALKGKNVVLYFYPKDDTPGCTVEAIDFSAKIADFDNKNTVVFGISKDDAKCHAKFVNKHSLRVALLADTTTEVCQKYGVWKEKSMMGKKYMGIERATFLVDSTGKIAKIWSKVSVEGHAADVLNSIG
jgi:peroxiredoxin Q/BCP